MARIVTCSQCKSSLSVPDDMLGKLVRCPNCTITFSVQANPEPLAVRAEPSPPPSLPKSLEPDELPPLDEDRDTHDRWRDRRDGDDRDRDRDWRSDRNYGPRRVESAWLTVKSGLNAMFIGALIVFGTALVCFLLVLVIGLSEAGGRRNNPAPGILAGLLICLGILVVLGGAITSLVGRFMCLSTPEPRARGFMIGHLIFLALNCVLAVVLFVLLVSMESVRDPAEQRKLQIALSLLGSLQVLIFLGSAIFLNLFLRGTAQSFDNSHLAGGCTAFIVFETIWLLAATGLTMLTLGLELNNIGGQGKTVAWALGAIIIGGGGGLVAVIWNLVLLRGCCNTIGQAQEENSRRRY